MQMRKRKNETVISFFIFFMAAILIENLLLPRSSFGILTALAGCIIIPLFWRSTLGDTMRFEVFVPVEDLFRSVGVALIIYVVSVGVSLGAEQILFHRLGNTGFLLQNAAWHYYSMELSTICVIDQDVTILLKWAGIVVSLLFAVFVELLFRGLILLSGLKSGLSFMLSNVRQAILFTVFYTVFTDVQIARHYIKGGNSKTILLSIGMILLFTVCTCLFAFGLGVLRKSMDSIWGSIVLMALIDFTFKEVHIIQYLPTFYANFVGLFRLCGFFLVAFLLTLPLVKQSLKRDW